MQSTTNQCVLEGESVILEMNDESRHFLQAFKGRDLRLKGFTIFGASIIGQPYGSVWEIVMPTKGSTASSSSTVSSQTVSASTSSSSSSPNKPQHKYNLKLVEDGDLYSEWWKKDTSTTGSSLPDTEASSTRNNNMDHDDDDDDDNMEPHDHTKSSNMDDHDNEETVNAHTSSSSSSTSSFPFQSGKDNRNLLQTNDSQSLSSEQIIAMKAQGKSTEIIQALIANSNTFHTKTIFSQEKYLRKKTAKYVHRFRILRPNTQNVSEMYLLTNPDKINHVRYDSLGLMLHLSNVQPGHNVMIFEQMSGLLVGAVTERMMDDKVIRGTRVSYHDDEEYTTQILLEQIRTQTLPLPPKSKGKIFCGIEDNKVCTNLFLYFRMNLSMDYEAKQLLVNIKYSELTNWIYRIANNDINNDKHPFVDSSLTTTTTTTNTNTTAKDKDPQNNDRKRNRQVSDDATGTSDTEKDTVMDTVPSTTTLSSLSSSASSSSSATVGPEGYQNRTPNGTIQWVPPKNKSSSSSSSATNNNRNSNNDNGVSSSSSSSSTAKPSKRNNTTSSVPNIEKGSRQYFHDTHFTSYPYNQEQRMSMLAEGIDSLLIAVPTDPTSLFLAAVRYMKPSSSFVIFHRDMIFLAQLFRKIRNLNIAVNVQLQETWTREYQILPNRTHPHMNMHNESGFLLSGTIIDNPYHCLPLYHQTDKVLVSSDLSSSSSSSSSSTTTLSLPHTILPITIQRKQDYYFMQKACDQAELCIPVPKAYNVGAILVKNNELSDKLLPSEWDTCILATGYSRELPGNTHAEEVCFLKVQLAFSALTTEGMDGTVQHSSSAATNTNVPTVVTPPDRSPLLVSSSSSSSSSSLSSFTTCTLYTTMEPCSERLSNKVSCTQLIQQINQYARQMHHQNCINRIVIGIREPPHLIAHCTGMDSLRGGRTAAVEDGEGKETDKIIVVHLQDEILHQRALKVNNHITST